MEHKFKAGDPVAVSNINGVRITTVEKVTPTGRIRVLGKYYNPDGCERTQSFWGMSWLKPVTDELIAQAKNYDGGK